MTMWPFARKSKSKGSRSASTMASHDDDESSAASRGLGQPSAGVERRPSRRQTKTSRRPPEPRTHSFSPGRREVIEVRRLVGQTSLPAASHQDRFWQRPPTLHKRSGPELPRRTSSKRRKAKHDREAEVKAMMASIPVPTRPATDVGVHGRPLKKDSKKMKGGLNRHLENPSSDVSLPSHESLNSSRNSSSNEEHSSSFKVTTAGVLSPHPTLRITEKGRYVPVAAWDDLHDPRRRRRISDRMPEEVLKAGKRVDELADDLDAGDLREILERDQRRRERRKLKEQQKTERRLQRRLERRHAEEAAAAHHGTDPPAVMERGIVGRELAGTPVESREPIVPAEANAPAVAPIPSEPPVVAAVTTTEPPSAADVASSLNSQHQPSAKTSTRASSADAVVETAQVARYSRPSMSPPPSPDMPRASINARMAEPAEDIAPLPTVATTKKPPSVHRRPSLAALFRRVSRKKSTTAAESLMPTPPATTTTQPSFSNTSRDSVANSLSLHANPLAYMSFTTAAMSSSLPKRTMSKFREDLPELPLSPPDSRVASPETEPTRSAPIPIPQKSSLYRAESRTRYDTPTSGYRSVEARLRNETPSSDHRTGEEPSPEPPVSQSLASIDSEGSWFAGRTTASKRSSSQLRIMRPRASDGSFARHDKGFSESNEDLDIMDDEYMKELAPGSEYSHGQRRSTDGAIPSSDEEDDGTPTSPLGSRKVIWHGNSKKQPRVVHRDRIKSSNGLNEFVLESDKEEDGDADSDHAAIQRATSVNLGKGHVRQISAGSARLLDVTRGEDAPAKEDVEMTDA